MINEQAIKTYIKQKFRDTVSVDISKLGSGVQGSGFLVEIKGPEGLRTFVVKALLSEGLGHDYPADRASVFLLDLDEFGNLPGHVKAVDVLAEMADGTIRSVGGGKEYYLLMERGEGKHYFHDLSAFAEKHCLDYSDKKKIHAMTSYLAGIHSARKDSRTLYWRKLRDTVGHGECLMGVFDTYPEGSLSYARMTDIIKKSVDRVYRLKPMYQRLSQIHGDFHPGNIWFKDTTDFVLLDRSRGPWGEPADDITALAINYIFFSIKNFGEVKGVYLEALNLFFDAYIRLSGDKELTGVVAPFFAFRAAVVANPVFYPELNMDDREKIINFADSVLSSDNFEIDKVNEYIKGR